MAKTVKRRQSSPPTTDNNVRDSASRPWLRRTLNAHSQPGARLLGVPGLTRQALDCCIDTFFSTIGQVFTLSQPQTVFTRRMRVCLYYSSGLDVPAELADIASQPASKLLILAVACRGALFSPHAALADDLYAHCARILAESDAVTTDYLDAIDSILLLSELTIQPRHATATELDPLGKGTVVDLALYHQLHIAPPPTSPDFQRRLALFSRIWAHDAIRSASAHTSFRISDDDFGWPMTPNAADIPYVALTLATREICATLLSPRAKGLGVSDDIVQQVLITLSGLRTRMKIDLDVLSACLAPGATPETEPLYPMNGADPLKPMEQLFMLSTHNWLYLVVWVAVQELSERHPGMLSALTIMNAESATLGACEDMATLAHISTSHGLHVRGPRSIRNHMAAFALFLVRVFSSIASPTVEQSARYFALAETLNFGVRSATYYPDSDTLANTLRVALYRAKKVASKDAARVAERGLDGLSSDATDINSEHQSTTVPLTLPRATATVADQAPAQQQKQMQYTSFVNPSSDYAISDTSIALANEEQQSFNSLNFPGSGDPADGAHMAMNSLDAFPPSTALSASPGSENVSIDWNELMDTLRDCGFELPLGPLQES